MKRLFTLNVAIAVTAVIVIAGAILLWGSGSFAGPANLSRTHTDGHMDHANMNHNMNMNPGDATRTAAVSAEASEGAPFKVLTGNSFELTAKVSQLKIDGQKAREVWTFNGTVPGPQLRVKQGETVQVMLKNELPEPVTIHWHGLPVPNNMDGIPGVTMNAVQPGSSFTYRFKADVPGTYWYHSHQDSVNQVDKGLYGSLVVVSAGERPVDRDYTVVLDEWMPEGMAGMHTGGTNGNGNMGRANMEGHGGMSMNTNGGHDGHGGMSMGANGGHGGMSMGGSANQNTPSGMPMSDAEMMPLMYTTYTANGKAGKAIPPLIVKEGENVRIRLINAGYISHQLHLQGHEYKIVSGDGQPIHNPAAVNGQLLNIAPGERYDIEFTANHPGKWLLDEHGSNPGVKDMTIPIVYEGAGGGEPKADNTKKMPVVDMTQYGETSNNGFSINDKYDLEYTMNLNTATAGNGFAFTINGNTFPDTEALKVKKGDLIKVKLVNQSPKDIHPMHLHGHFFQVLSKNGQPVSGSPLIKDTLNLLPGEEYEVAFKADNPGDWMFHCHDLGHASQGMVTMVKYDGFKPDFTVDPKAGNKPE